jgi:hypothetical protein
VGRKRVREQIIAATRPSLGSGEYIRSCCEVWATECGGRVPLLFRGRGRHYVAITDRRLILYPAPRRRRPLRAESMLLAKRHPTFTLERTRAFSPLLQLRIRDLSGREIAFEFRPRDRKVGRELAALLTARRELPRVTGGARRLIAE